MSLFTNTPINETLDVIKKRLEDDTNLKLRTNLDVDDLMELLKFIVTTTYFSVRGTINQQKFGTAMGIPVSTIITNLLIEWLEEQAILTAPITCKSKLWKRYDNSLPFMDKLLIRKEDGTVKLLVYRMKTHTDQYINFTSQYPLHQKLGFNKTLLNRCNTIVSEPEDREKEVEYIIKALERCGYSSWTIKKMKEHQLQKGKTKKKRKRT